MSLLLDTHAFIWWSLNDPRLPARMRSMLCDEAETVYVSTASIWEIAIKFASGRLPQVEIFLADLRTGKALGSLATKPARGPLANTIISGVIVMNDQNVLWIRLLSRVRWAL